MKNIILVVDLLCLVVCIWVVINLFFKVRWLFFWELLFRCFWYWYSDSWIGNCVFCWWLLCFRFVCVVGCGLGWGVGRCVCLCWWLGFSGGYCCFCGCGNWVLLESWFLGICGCVGLICVFCFWGWNVWYCWFWLVVLVGWCWWCWCVVVGCVGLVFLLGVCSDCDCWFVLGFWFGVGVVGCGLVLLWLGSRVCRCCLCCFGVDGFCCYWCCIGCCCYFCLGFILGYWLGVIVWGFFFWFFKLGLIGCWIIFWCLLL